MSEVAVTANLPGPALERLRERHAVRVHTGSALGGAALARFVGQAEALVCIPTDGVNEVVFQSCPGLKVVALCAVGYDNVDLRAAASAGVVVTNTPDVLTDATADLAWTLILAVTRRIVEGDRLLRSGVYRGWKPDFFLGMGLQGKAIGIVGMGRIGQAVARRARAFGMRVLYHDPVPAGEVAGDAEYFPTLDALLPHVAVLSLHCPLSGATHHLIDARRLRLLPPGAVLINTARGKVVDEAGLVEVLEEGHLGGAGLDVFEYEPTVHPGLLERSDVVLLPHIGSATIETRQSMALLAAENAMAVLSGEAPATPVRLPAAP